MVDGQLWGAVAAASVGAPFTSDTEARLGAFAELVGQAIANVDARQKLTASRARIVEATDAARRRIERDLHDGAQQRLVALALSLRMAAKSAEAGTAAAIETCIEELQTALQELRELARGIHPVVLTERGLEPALQALAARSPVPVRIVAELDGRLPPAQEAALYYVAAEALTNVAKHARAEKTDVRVGHPDGWAELDGQRRRRRRRRARRRLGPARPGRPARRARRAHLGHERARRRHHRPCPRAGPARPYRGLTRRVPHDP